MKKDQKRNVFRTSQTLKVELISKVAHGFQTLTILAKSFSLDVRLGFECASEYGFKSHLYYRLLNIIAAFQT